MPSPLLEYIGSEVDNPLKPIYSRSIWPASIPDKLLSHWGDQKGDEIDKIDPSDRSKQVLENEDGIEVPVIMLDCENGYPDSKYNGNFYEVCKNFLWFK